MRFAISVSIYRCGDTDWITPDTPPLPGAVLVDRWVEETRKREWYTEKNPKAVLDGNGNPTIVYKEKRIEQFGMFPRFNVGKWRQEGRNHQVTDTHYVREVNDPSWVIDIDTLEQLVELAKETDFTVEFDGKPIIRIYG